MRPTDLPLIRRSRLFSQVSEHDLKAMLEPCFVQTLTKGATPCQQGEGPEFFHVVLSVGVGLFGEGPREEALIEFFGPGDGFVMAAVMLEAPYLVTARMLEGGRVLFWPAKAFRTQLRGNAALGYGAALQLSSYWRTLIRQIKDLKLLSAVERVSAMLLALAPRQSGSVNVILPGGRRMIAGRLGVTPPTLSRAFAALRPLGVSGNGRQVTIAEIGRLREVAGGIAFKRPPEPSASRRAGDEPRP
jgi:CRP/FNR family transcriptional activator FtrB